MGKATRDASEQVAAARRALGSEIDELGSAARSAVDIPAKVRKHPVETAGLAGGAVFLAVGGPKRVLRAVEARVRPSRRQRFRGVLPKDVEQAIDRLGDNAAQVRERIESDFAEYMSKRTGKESRPSAQQSFWKTYDALVGPLGRQAAKRLASRLFAADPERERKADRQG